MCTKSLQFAQVPTYLSDKEFEIIFSISLYISIRQGEQCKNIVSYLLQLLLSQTDAVITHPAIIQRLPTYRYLLD